jgi:hypothetical protein
VAETIHTLTGLETVGVSLVRRGANKKKFAIFKSEEGMADNLEELEILKAVVETPMEQEPNPAEILKAELSDKALTAAKGMMRLASAFKDEPGMEQILGKLASMSGIKKPEKQDKACPKTEKKKSESKEGDKPLDFKKEEPKGDDGMKDEDTVKTKKSLDDLPDEMKLQVEKLWKSHDEAIKKAEGLEKVLKAERDERLKKEFIAKAEVEYDRLKAEPKELGEVLKSLHTLDHELGAKVEEILKSANEVIKQADAFKEIGTSHSRDAGGSAWGKIEQMANSIVEKGEEQLTKSQAIDRVMQQNPTLYSEYINENPSQYGEGMGA